MLKFILLTLNILGDLSGLEPSKRGGSFKRVHGPRQLTFSLVSSSMMYCCFLNRAACWAKRFVSFLDLGG